jgi:large subunit ribosomal protein L21
MYAVVEIGGHQYKVAENDVIFVDRQSEEKDGELTFDRVLLLNDGKDTKVGTPVVDGAEVKATVLDHLKDDKVIVFKKKRRKGYRVKRGHRQALTQLKIEKISA